MQSGGYQRRRAFCTYRVRVQLLEGQRLRDALEVGHLQQLLRGRPLAGVWVQAGTQEVHGAGRDAWQPAAQRTASKLTPQVQRKGCQMRGTGPEESV